MVFLVRSNSPSHLGQANSESSPHRFMLKSQGMNSLSMTAAAAAVSTDDGNDPPLFKAPLKGIRRDYKMRLPLYKSDITQCLAAICFLFFACPAPAVGFGALFGAATNGAIGTLTVSSTAMPLTIIGSTGQSLQCSLHAVIPITNVVKDKWYHNPYSNSCCILLDFNRSCFGICGCIGSIGRQDE